MDVLSLAKDYLRAIEAGKAGDEIAAFYDTDARQVEYPNRLYPATVIRNVSEIKEASLRGQQVLTSQRFDIQRSFVSGNTVILETVWTGTFAIPAGSLQPGEEMKAYFAQFIEFNESGRIIHQRTYDCFEEF